MPLKILESWFSEATEAVEHSKIVEISERDGMKVVTMHARYHDTLREMLSRQETAPCGKRRKNMQTYDVGMYNKE